MRIDTGIMVGVAVWNKAHSSVKELAKFNATEEGKRVNGKAEEVDGVISKFFEGRKTISDDDKALLLKRIGDVVHLDAIKAEEELEKRRRDEERRKREEDASRLLTVMGYYEYFLAGIKDGSIRHGEQKRYGASSLSSWVTFGKHLKGFLEAHGALKLTFEEIDRATPTAFTTYLESRQMMKSTIGQQINHFRKLCNIAAEDGKNRNGASLKVWSSCDAKDEEKRAEIVLTDGEIDALYNMRLEGYVEQCRDLWILGYFSAQRVSDFSVFSKENFAVNGDGTPVIRLRQKKTGTQLEVPILDDRVFDICDKYNYHFPSLGRDAINRGIKMACKQLAESVPSLNEWEVTLLSAKERDKEAWYIETRKRVEAGEKLHGEATKRYKRMMEYADAHDSGDMLYSRDYQGRVIRRRWD